jgi:hypothetical protein
LYDSYSFLRIDWTVNIVQFPVEYKSAVCYTIYYGQITDFLQENVGSKYVI